MGYRQRQFLNERMKRVVRYYVDATNGNDSNSGRSPTSAWQTLDPKVNGEAFLPGEHVQLIRDGEWREELTLPSSGLGGKKVRYGAYGNGARPIINGADIITGWTLEGGTPNVWEAALTIEPNQVFFDDTKGTLEVAVANLNALEEWFWVANVLYVYSLAGDPDTEFTSPGIEASVRDQCIDLANKDHIALRDLHTTKSNREHGANIFDWDNTGVARTGLVIKNMESSDAFSHGITIALLNAGGTWSDIAVSGCQVYDNGNASLGLGVFISGVDAAQMSGVRIFGNLTSNNVAEGIAFGNGSALIYENTSDGDGLSWAAGIRLQSHAVNVDIFRNYMKNSIAEGIWIDGRWSTGLRLFYNIIDSPGDAGITLSQSADGTEIYNNVLWNVNNGIRLGSTAQVTNAILKNNIVDSIVTATNVQIENGSTFVSDHNCFDEAIFIPFEIGGVPQSWAEWRALGHDANGLYEDAKMTNPGGKDFTLASDSPCRAAGVDVGLVRDYAGIMVPQETDPAIGAREYVP